MAGALIPGSYNPFAPSVRPGAPGAGAVLDPSARERMAREQAERTAKAKAQEDYDKQYIGGLGNIGGTGTPSRDAVSQVQAMLALRQQQQQTGLIPGPNGGAGGASSSSSSSASRGGNDFAQQKEMLELQARLTAEAEARRMAMIRTMQQGQPTITGTAGDHNDAAARQAAFARAKDQVGLSSRAALDSLRDIYAGSGNMGSMRQGAEDIVGGGMDQLGEVSRDIALSEAERAGQVADRNYSGSITQRGQDYAYLQQLLGLFNARPY